MSTTPERPAKRTRQACEPCRRKKSRCPGEKPTCSHCARLSQACTYAPDRGDQSSQHGLDAIRPSGTSSSTTNAETATHDRLRMLEAGMAQLQNLLGAAGPVTPVYGSHLPTQRTPDTGRRSTANNGRPEKPDESDTKIVADLYATYCDCQPLPLFSMKNWPTRLASSETELFYAVFVLVDRFRDLRSPSEERLQYLESARRSALDKILEGRAELSTIQTLCVLSLLEFNENNTGRASTFTALAFDLAQSAGLGAEFPSMYDPDMLEERRRCYWSLVLLRNLYGNLSGTIAFSNHDMQPKYPRSAQPPAGSSSTILEPGLPQPDATADPLLNIGIDDGILAYMIEISEIWSHTVRYAHLRGKRQQHPSWAPESDYQKIMAQLMRVEEHLPYKYRYKPSSFEVYSEHEIQRHRTFWAPFYLMQILYHSLLCFLNHPLILSLQLRNFKITMVPEVFLQHTDDLIQTHTNWVIHLIDQAGAKNFAPSDAYPAYCVAVVATIFLQQSYADDDNVRQTKQENFQKCLQFVQNTGRHWPRVARLAEKVERFSQVVAQSSQKAAAAGDGKTYIDLSLFWEILESCFTSELSAASENFFGSTLHSLPSNATSANVVNGRLLPPPTRLDRQPSTTATPILMNGDAQYQSGTRVFPPVNDQLQVLAQSYFAQGDNFVNFDDWWYPDQNVG